MPNNQQQGLGDRLQNTVHLHAAEYVLPATVRHVGQN